jgi:Holliday junction resolvase RusA-like endonuclease
MKKSGDIQQVALFKESGKDSLIVSINFTLTRLPPSLNEMLHMHWSKRCSLQKIFDDQVFAEWLRCGRAVFLYPVRLLYVLSFPTKRLRDVDNYIGGTKLITDALKKTFLFRDDADWIKEIQVQFTRGDEETVVFIIEAGA